jgi:hypothetical protein
LSDEEAKLSSDAALFGDDDAEGDGGCDVDLGRLREGIDMPPEG